MTLAQKVLQLKQDIDAVYQAGLADGGGTPPSRVRLVGKGQDTLDLTVKDNTIYHISEYLKINISPPLGVYQTYLYVNLPAIEGASLSFDKTISVTGHRLEDLKPGDVWEVSMDSSMGTLLLNTSKLDRE